MKNLRRGNPSFIGETGGITTDKWQMIIELCELSELENNGATEWTETAAANGQTYTRVIKCAAATATAARLLRDETTKGRCSRADMDRARAIIDLAQWKPAEGAASNERA